MIAKRTTLLTAAILAASLMLTSAALAIGGGETGTLTAKPKSPKKGKKVTATATGCASGVDSDGVPYTASVDFLFIAPSRPVHIPKHSVATDASGTASYSQRLRMVGTWQLAAYCMRDYPGDSSGPGIAFEYDFAFVHVHKPHGGSGGGR